MKPPKIGEKIRIPWTRFINHNVPGKTFKEVVIIDFATNDKVPKDHFEYYFVKLEGYEKLFNWKHILTMHYELGGDI